MDDLTTEVDGVLDGFEFYKKAKSRISGRGFNLRKWTSNSSELMKLINESEGRCEVPARSVLEKDETYATTKGDDEDNTLGVTGNHRAGNLIMELITPVLILMKILLQELRRDKKPWDEPLEHKTANRGTSWIADLDLQRIGDIAVPRCYIPDAAGRILSAELHGFSDPLNTAYAAVVYLRMVTESGTVTRIVASKTRVAPLSKQTFPRLELLGAVILSRLAVYIKEVLGNLSSLIDCVAGLTR